MFYKFLKLLKLKIIYCYLAGAIEADKKEGGQGWRNAITPPLDEVGIYVGDPCLAKGTPILMSDLSYKMIEKIQIGDEIFGYKRNYLQKTIVTQTYKRKKMTYKLIFEDGRNVIITENHPILQFFKFSSKNRNNNNYIKPHQLEQTRLCVQAKCNQNADWKRGYIAGFLDGDGNITFDDKLRFFQKDKGQLEYIEKLLNELYRNVKGSYYRDKRTGVYTLGIYSPILSRKIIADTEFPKSASNKSYFRGYLAGIYDAEGWKKGYDQVIISNTDYNLIEKTKKCLDMLGHSYTLRQIPRKNKKWKDIYRLTFHLFIKPQRANFVIECQPYQRQYLIQDKYQINNSKNLKVKSIIPFKKLQVYNFETSTHNYIANGIIVHNCLTEPLVTGMDVIQAQEKFNGWIQSGNYAKFAEKFAKVVEKDIRMVHRSDFLIVHLFPDIPTTGTIHEMGEAWRTKKIIYIIWKEAMSKLSKWALYLCTSSGGRVFSSKKKLVEYLSIVYDVKKLSLRIQIIQFVKAIFRIIEERIFNFRLSRIKSILKELESSKIIKKEEPKKPKGDLIKENKDKEKT